MTHDEIIKEITKRIEITIKLKNEDSIEWRDRLCCTSGYLMCALDCNAITFKEWLTFMDLL